MQTLAPARSQARAPVAAVPVAAAAAAAAVVIPAAAAAAAAARAAAAAASGGRHWLLAVGLAAVRSAGPAAAAAAAVRGPALSAGVDARVAERLTAALVRRRVRLGTVRCQAVAAAERAGVLPGKLVVIPSRSCAGLAGPLTDMGAGPRENALAPAPPLSDIAAAPLRVAPGA